LPFTPSIDVREFVPTLAEPKRQGKRGERRGGKRKKKKKKTHVSIPLHIAFPSERHIGDLSSHICSGLGKVKKKREGEGGGKKRKKERKNNGFCLKQRISLLSSFLIEFLFGTDREGEIREEGKEKGEQMFVLFLPSSR